MVVDLDDVTVLEVAGRDRGDREGDAHPLVPSPRGYLGPVQPLDCTHVRMALVHSDIGDFLAKGETGFEISHCHK